MTETDFKNVFTQFLGRYWGAFHEVLEAQSVTPRRLAKSLFETLRAEHRAFADVYTGPDKTALEELGRIWHDVGVRAYASPDPALTREQVARAHGLFDAIYDGLAREGDTFPAARRQILKAAPHGSPKQPLRADATR
jgi:hypothetical protein